MTDSPPDNEAIFYAARQVPDPDRRREYVREACGADEARIARIEALLAAAEGPDSLLDRPGAANPMATISLPATESHGTLIGPYKLIEQIGEGGMGSVWMAQQTKPVKRLVAVKLIKAGMDSRQVIARFEAERQALALMDHANIARVLDGGTTSAGRPFFVMDLVKGIPITRYCDDHHLTPRQRLELFIPLCQAVQHAHQKGIIHRDLKPSNVLVALYDGRPVPKIIDFGVAKAEGQGLTEKTLVTGFGAIVGTLEYMSPEQAEVNQLDIDTRSDIYSLGVLLYELLTGSPPFSRKELEKAGMLEMLRVIREQEPTKPSTKLSTSDGLPTLAANRGTEPAKLTKLLRGELDWIVMKALEKDRSRRYETANGFAMDVQRYLADEPVLACPPSAGYRLRKFARRNRGGLAVAALSLFFLVLLGSGAGWVVRDRSARETEAARQQGERQAKVAGQVISISGEVDRLENEQKWPEALEAARRAEAAVAVGEADPATAERVHQQLRELEFIDRLERIRMERATHAEGLFDIAGADRDFARAFREFGVDVDELPVETSIDRLKARPALAIVLAVALDDWARARRQVPQEDAGRWKQLVAVARGIDPEPLRDRVRSAWGQPVASVPDDLRRLADSIDVRAQHTATLELLTRTLQQVQQSDSALRILREAHFVHPGDFWLNFELGSVLQQQGDFEGAVRFYTAAVASQPSSAGAHNNLGNALFALKKPDEAIARYRKAIELDPKFAGAYRNLALALRDQGNLDEAIVAFEEVTRRQPDFPEAHYGLASVLAQAKQWDRSARVYAAALKRFGGDHWPGPWFEAIRSNEVFTCLTAQQPDDRLPWIMRARLYVFERDWKRAAADYSRVNESWANMGPAELAPEGDDLFSYGCLLLLLGDRHGFEQFCKKWADAVGDSPACRYSLARARAISPRPVVPSEQIVALAETILQAGRYPWNLHILSLAHYRNGEFELAAERALESNGGNWRGSAKALNWVVLAMAHSRLGHAADARKSLQQALKLAGRASPVQRARVEWPDMAVPDVVEFELLRREAEELSSASEKEKPDKK
jgi:serine/threonine protein kinase/tetratricopeptide (TPR) repeat protein